MEQSQAVEAFGALSQDTRLSVLRLLVKDGVDGLAAGDIAKRVGVPPATLSFHVAALERTGLVRSWRVQRQIFYAPSFAGIRGLLRFLTTDCCAGRPELCADLFAADSGACTDPSCAPAKAKAPPRTRAPRSLKTKGRNQPRASRKSAIA